MKTHRNPWRFLAYGVFAPLVTALAIVGGPAPSTPQASAWSTPTLSVGGDACGEVDVTMHNPENQPARVVSSNAFTVGSVAPPKGTLTTTVRGTGSLHVVVTVNFPDHASASTDVHFRECPPPSTTTTTSPPPGESTTTTAPPTTTTTPGEPPTAPRFTG